MKKTLLNSTVAVALAVAAASAGAATSITPPSTAIPAANDNGNLMLLVWDSTTGRSLVDYVGLRINGTASSQNGINQSSAFKIDMTTPGTVLDFGNVNLSSLQASSSSELQYMLIASDYAPGTGGAPPNAGPDGIPGTPDDFPGTPPTNLYGNNVYMTGSGYGTLTDADRGKVAGASFNMKTYFEEVFNNAGNIPNPFIQQAGCGHVDEDTGAQLPSTNPCATVNSYDPRYFGLSSGGPVGYTPDNFFPGACNFDSEGHPAGCDPRTIVPWTNVGTALDFWALNISSDEHLSKTQYAGKFSLDADGHLTYAVSAVPLPAAGWLLISGLLGLGTVSRRRPNQPAAA